MTGEEEYGYNNDALASFQQNKSDFVSIAKFLVKELAANMSHLEDIMYMLPGGVEKRSTRDGYRDFRRAFRDLYFLTFNSIDPDLRKAVQSWFAYNYNPETKNSVFQTGLQLAELYLSEMYNLGILDLAISKPSPMPYEELLEDVYMEAQMKSSEAPDPFEELETELEEELEASEVFEEDEESDFEEDMHDER